MKFDLKAILEWSLLAVVILCFILWAGYTRPARAQGGYYKDRGGKWFDPNVPQNQQWVPTAPQPRSRYVPEERPDHYGPVEQRPEMTIYRGRGYQGY